MKSVVSTVVFFAALGAVTGMLMRSSGDMETISIGGTAILSALLFATLTGIVVAVHTFFQWAFGKE